MSKLRRVGGGLFVFGATAIAIASCAQDAREFTPVDGGGEGGDGPGSGGRASGGTSSGGQGGESSGGSATGGSGGTVSSCTDELPNGDECGGDCEPCPDGLACESADDCEGDVCTDDGACCTSAPEDEICAGKCGSIDNCGDDVSCATCVGEATCSSENVCGCPARPCAIQTFSFGNANQEYIAGMAVDGSGNVYVVGDFRGTLQFGDVTLTAVVGPSIRDDIFLVKFDPMGQPIWAKSFGDGSAQEARGVAVDGAGNVVIIGRSSGTINFGGADLAASDLVVAKFSADGQHVFSDRYGNGNFQPWAVAIDQATGDVIVTGQFWDNLTFGSYSLTSAGSYSYFDGFLLRFDAAMAPQHARRFGANYDEQPTSVGVVGDYAYVAGTFADAFSFGAPNAVTLTATGWSDLFVAKLGRGTFSHGWSLRFGDNGSTGYAVEKARLVVDPPTGDVIVTGNFTGDMEFSPALSTTETEIFLARLASADGASVWAKQFAKANVGALAIGPGGHLFLVGYAEGDVDFGGGIRPASGSNRDVFIARFDGGGEHIYSRVFASPVGDQQAEAVATTQAGEAWIGARFDGQLEFGMDTLQSQGGNDIALGKYAP